MTTREHRRGGSGRGESSSGGLTPYPARVTSDSSSKAATAPHPDDDRKPKRPTDVKKPSWKYVLGKAFREFTSDNCTDLAAALTYFMVLAIFPALIALVSLLGVVGEAESTISTVLDIVRNLGGATVADTIQGPVSEIVKQVGGAGLGLGLLTAIFSASGYVNAFSRAMNQVYEIDEGRPVWKLRPVMILITVVMLVLVALALLIIVVSGPVAQAIGDVVGLGSTALTVWAYAKWPVLALIIVLVIAILYYFTPNVKQPKFRWMSMGSFVAIIIWLLASLGFFFYVANFGSYNATYGSLAGVIIALLWLWITNNALLFGAEIDAEVERGRELQAGLAAEETIQLPPRDTSKADKAAAKEAEDVEKARALRLSGGETRSIDEARAQTGRHAGSGDDRDSDGGSSRSD